MSALTLLCSACGGAYGPTYSARMTGAAVAECGRCSKVCAYWDDDDLAELPDLAEVGGWCRVPRSDELHRWRAGEADRVPGMVETAGGVMVCHERAPRWWAQLWGGWSYTWGDEAEPFETLADVADEYRRRRSDPYFPTWGDVDWPALGETTRVGLIWRYADENDGAEVATGYPDATLELGPRGGLRVVPA